MTTMDRNMFSPMGIFFLIIFVMESIVSLLANGFIIVVNGYSWVRSTKLLPCDFLLSTLSLSRFLFQGVSMISQFLFFSYPETYVRSKEKQIFSISWSYLNMATLWGATWLNVFYCVKVTNFAHPLFAWLKLRIGVLVPRCLGISLLAFIICSIHPLIQYFDEEKWCNFTRNLVHGTRQGDNHVRYVFPSLQKAFVAINFSICVSASMLLLSSLGRHIRNLKKNGLSTKDISTQAHLRVMKPLLLSLFFYILHFTAIVIVFTDLLQYGKLERLISDMVLLLYPAAHSVILIFTNPKLNKAYIHAIHFGRSAS